MTPKEQTILIWLVIFGLCALGTMAMAFCEPDWRKEDARFLLRVFLILAAVASIMAVYAELTME